MGSLFQTRDAVDEKDLKWPLMFSSVVQIRILDTVMKMRTGVIVYLGRI